MKVDVAADVSAELYDVVIIGAGIAGSIVAKHLADGKRKILVLEAGTGQSFTSDGYATNLDRYFAADAKVPNAPYALNPDAPQGSRWRRRRPCFWPNTNQAQHGGDVKRDTAARPVVKKSPVRSRAGAAGCGGTSQALAGSRAVRRP